MVNEAVRKMVQETMHVRISVLTRDHYTGGGIIPMGKLTPIKIGGNF